MSAVRSQDKAPAGYALPVAAVALMEHAAEHGWLHIHAWSEDNAGSPFVRIQVGRKVTAADGETRGPFWRYSITWHNRNLPAGMLHLFGPVIAQTPGNPALHQVASLKAVREAITKNPGTA